MQIIRSAFGLLYSLNPYQ